MGTKKEMSSKMEDVKKGASEKKEDISNQINEIKEGASEKKEDIEENVDKVKKEVEEKKEKLEKDSKKEGMTPAEKILNDLVKKFQQGTGQINEAITDYTTEPETSKKPKMALKPLVDVLETNDTITLIADISGVKKDDIDIGISKNSVEITTMYKEEPELEDAKFTQKERSYGKTHRTIPLSTEIKVKEAKAKYKACTLTITLPKKVKDIIKVKIED
ncbi:Hsp20/alpha crystallin family protein [Methanobacterium sp. SMA-27]|uniref:Hsp20/alpha crystallin family protein n=1 Tax=Methanobacterium sp. SMA-27 TaxID=1495336 RepID=UPI0006939EC1|nr:Hsp20/alpha crystallin family protein [Methanobacterium sp. SMA-27]